MRRIAMFGLLGVVLLGGCRGPAKTGYERTYPAFLERGRTIDIQVASNVTKIELTNTTAQSFGPSTIWLNMWFSRPIDSFRPGQTLRFGLREFRDEHGDAFRAGGFFATREPDRIVLAELETDEGNGPVLLRLIVVGQTDPQR